MIAFDRSVLAAAFPDVAASREKFEAFIDRAQAHTQARIANTAGQRPIPRPVPPDPHSSSTAQVVKMSSAKMRRRAAASIRNAREILSLSQADLANRAALPLGTILRCELGHASSTDDDLMRIFACIDELLTAEEEKRKSAQNESKALQSPRERIAANERRLHLMIFKEDNG